MSSWNKTHKTEKMSRWNKIDKTEKIIDEKGNSDTHPCRRFMY